MKLFRSVLLLVLFPFSGSLAQLTVNTAISDGALIQNHLLGPGVCAKNIRWSGTQGQRAVFTCTNNCPIGFPSGVLITSGSAAIATGNNTAGGAGLALGLGGDPDLNAIDPIPTHHDAGVIEFDFSVPSDSIEFRFVFASEEYNDYVNTGCNDVFGFFISGPGYAGPTNIALIPNTTTQIAINNVNNGNSGPGTVPTGPCANCQYYVDHTGGVGTQYDGRTVILTARAQVQPCKMYHFKMGVQDNCDGAFDSGVFFEANSFQATGEIPLSIGGNTLENHDTVYICPGDSFLVTMPQGPNTLWSTGDTTQSITITQPGIYYGTISDTCCFAFSVRLYVLPQPTVASISASGPTSFCNGDSVILNAAPSGPSLNYLWSNGATTSSIVVNSSGSYSVTISSGNCVANSTPVPVTVTNNPIASITASGPVTFCSGNSVTLTSANPAMNYSWSTGATTSAISVNSSGTYILTLSSNGCTTADTMQVTVNTPIPVSITTGAIACTGSPTQLNATSGFTSYSWSTGQSSSSVSVSTAGIYSVTATDVNGCTDTDTYNFAPLPFTPPTITSVAGFCAGSTSVLNADPGYATYAWNNGATSANLTVSNGGTYTVTVTAANGCSGTASASIQQWPLPVPVITGNFTVCSGTAANLSAGPAGLSYAWSNGASQQTISPLTAGTYTVTVTDANQCSASASQQVTVNSAPVFTISGDFIACSGESGLLDAGTGFGAYAWSDGSLSNSTAPTVQGWYTVTVTDNGCSATDSIFFTVNPLPAPVITGAPDFCPGYSTTLAVNQSFPSYLWSTGSTASTVIITTPSVVSVTVTDANGCQGNTALTVNAFTAPVPSLPASVSFCANQSAVLQPGNFSAYAWSDNSTSATLMVTSGGTYTVTVTDANGCTGTATSAVTLNPLPSPSIAGPSEICNGENAQLITGNYSSYQWSDGTSQQQLTTGTSGTYTVTVTDANGCTNETSATLIVNPLPLVSISGPTDFCDGGNVTITTLAGQGIYTWSTGSSSNTINVNSTGNYAVTVTSADGCSNSASYQVNERPIPVVDFEIQQSPACNEILVQFFNLTQAEPGSAYYWDFGDSTNSIKNAPQHSYYTPGNYTVTLYATSPYGCKSEDTLSFDVDFPPAPVASFTFTPDIVSIYNSKVQFRNQSLNAVRYKWNFGDGQTSEEVNPVHAFDRIGEQIITLYAFNSDACYDEIQLPLEVVPFWIPNAFTPNNDGKNDVFFDGNYVMDVNSFRMQIFDRWGKQVYATDSMSKPWDGNIDGTPGTIGLYSYLISVEATSGKEFSYKGTFSLLR